MEYKIGQIIFADDMITVNDGRDTVELVVNNSGDRVNSDILCSPLTM